MIFEKEIKQHIISLFLLSLGGLLLHLRIHPFDENPTNLIPFIFGVANISLAPFFFNFKKTFLLAYLINGFGVILGTITMITFSISGFTQPITLSKILLRTTLADVFILLPKLFLAQRILYFFYPTGVGRMFIAWWWVRHFCYVTIIFLLGYLLWR